MTDNKRKLGTGTDFDVYLRQTEPHMRERAASWKTAVGLQAVDGLKTSEYLLETARRHIEGDISIDEARKLIDAYYQAKPRRIEQDAKTEEADRVSANIAKLLNERTFSFSPVGYITLHRRIFEGVFKFAGQIRDYNITKKEWVLNSNTVLYAGADEIRPALEHDFAKEAAFSYQGLSLIDMIRHIAKFVANLWQIHAFGEGNTRTTAVFTIKYLRSMGFEVNNDLFAEHSWYFRNALVRANYHNFKENINPTLEFLERFFQNLLMDEHHELKNRHMLVNAHDKLPANKTPQATPQATPQVASKLNTDNPNILKLVAVLEEKQMTLREMLGTLHLRDRKNFLEAYLRPAIEAGFVRLLYPESPRHPRQQYLLTAKGFALLEEQR